MTQEEFLKKLIREYEVCTDISRKKNADYSANNDAFLNFRSTQNMGISPATAIMVRMGDKMARVGNLLKKKGLVEDESIHDTLRDLANYSLILSIYLQAEGHNELPVQAK